MAGGGAVTGSRTFSSWLASHFDRFVALRRASGARYVSQRSLLLTFDRYLSEQVAEPPLSRETLLRYLDSLDHLSPRGRDNVVGVVWPAVASALLHGAAIEALPPRPPKAPQYWRHRSPRILSSADVRDLMAAARRLPPAGSLRAQTTTTLIGLLYVTGLRIGEALGLDVGDLDRCDRILTVRKGKFGKSRALPLRESTARALIAYIDHPLRPVATHPSAPLFVSRLRRRLSDPTFRVAFQQVCRTAQLAEPWPRLHDFRHTFAVRRVLAAYEQEQDLDRFLPALSTYLGHASVENTRLYLSANGALLKQASRRFADLTSALDEVAP